MISRPKRSKNLKVNELFLKLLKKLFIFKKLLHKNIYIRKTNIKEESKIKLPKRV